MDHGGERDPVRYAQLGEHVPQVGVHGVRRDLQPPGHRTAGQSPGAVPVWVHDLGRRWQEEQSRTRVIVGERQAASRSSVPCRAALLPARSIADTSSVP